MAKFPSEEWVAKLHEKLNSDTEYARVAQNWEGDMKFIIDPSGSLTEQKVYYLDLWHGTCRKAYAVQPGEEAPDAAFVLRATYDSFARVVGGKLDPIQAMLTRKLSLQGNMVVIMRSVPTVMNFVRCCREVTDGFV